MNKYRKTAIKELSELTGVELSKKAEIIEKNNIIFVDKIPYFFLYKKEKIPTLHCLKNNDFLPSIIIDEGAIKFLIKGADMMRPGIIKFEEFKENETVVIKGPSSNFPLGVGKSLFSSNDAKIMSSGKIIKVLHYTGDIIWNASLH